MTAAAAADLARALWRAYGVRGAVARVAHEVRKKAGLYRSMPADVPMAALQAPLPSPWPFIVDPERVREATDRPRALARADRVLGGEHEAYRWTWTRLPRTPVEWRTHPATGFEHAIDRAWFAVAHYDARAGDVKDVWEPARFAWSYDLARGWMLTGDNAYAEKFWELTESFLDGNPPFKGVHWSCGQETAIRAIAWLYAEAILASAPASTPARLSRLRRALVWSGERIEDALTYAVIQRNNHGISELAGLAAIGARFLDADPRARGWLERANTLLEAQILDQFAEDGWYLQHSFNYARLALEQVVVAQRALRSRGLGISDNACARVTACVTLLAELTDADTGRVPLHGPNDGAYVLPLSTALYTDYRPALTAAAVACGSALPAEVRPDPEVLAWLGASPPPVSPRHPAAFVRGGPSGWVIGQVADALFFARAGRYVSRPAHIDPMHVDIRVAGQPVAIDAGTYRYWDVPPWVNGLANPEVHNIVTIEGMPLARRGPRYLWVEWPSARVDSSSAATDSVRVDLVNETWLPQGVTHRRICELTATSMTVTDELTAPAALRATVFVHWLLDVDPSNLSMESSAALDIAHTRGDVNVLGGWQSEGYAVRRPVTSVRGTTTLERGSLRVVSTFDLAAVRAHAGAEHLETATLDAS